MSAAAPDVAVLGCGLMGTALARTLAAQGHEVVVWNRTPDRAERLGSVAGVRVAHDVADAVTGTPLVLACMSTYGATRQALDPLSQWGGSTLVTFATGGQHDAVAMQRWAVGREAAYLDGALLTFPDFVGQPDAMVLYSGARETWERHRGTLMALGGASQHVAEDPGAANVLDTAVIGSFYIPSVTAYVESASYALAQGVPSDVLRAATRLVVRTLGHSAKEALDALERDDHTAGQATLATYAAGARHGVVAMRSAGWRARLLGATAESLQAAEHAGLGDRGIYAQALVARSDV